MRLPVKWLYKVSEEAINDVADMDFNPDIVCDMAYEMYETGFEHGLVAAGALATIVLVGCVIGHFRGKKETK